MAYSSIDNLILSFITSFAITYLAVPSIIRVAREKNLFDEPDDRASHKYRKPTLGGLAIFAGIIFSITFWTDFTQCWRLQYLLAATTVISFIGLYDDILRLSPFKKAIGQIVATCILVVWGDIRISSFGGIFGIQELPYIISIIFSIFTIFIIINSINLIDGIDGLATTLGIIYSFTFGVYFFMLRDMNQEAIVAFSLVGALLAFLRFNSAPAKIFMGDTGSMMIGLIIAVLTIEFIEVNKSPSFMYHFNSAPAVAIGFLIVPLFDLLRVFALRIFRKRSPFIPDRNHIHHLLLNLGFSHNFSTFIIAVFTLFVIISVIIFRNIGTYPLLIMVIVFKLIFLNTVVYFSKKKEKEKLLNV